MNICFAIGTLKYSGAEKIVRYLIDELNHTDKVSVMLFSCTKPIDCIPIQVAQYPLYIEEKNPIIRVAKRIKGIRSIVAQNKFDIVVSFGVVFNMDVALALRGLKTKLVLCERNDPVYDPRKKLQRLRRRVTYPLANGYVFQTETIKSFFSKSIQKRSTVIPNFIESNIDTSQKYNPTRNSFATSARLDDNQKNQKVMIKAFSTFLKKHPGYMLEFYGDGPDRRLLQSYAESCGVAKSVLFMGRIDNPMERIKNCKGFLLTSKFEGMPNSLIEAMAYGMPCIATDCSGGGAKELIDNGKNGLLVPIGDSVKISKAMDYLVDNSDIAFALGNAAYNINDRLDFHKIINMWKSYFISIVNTAPKKV